MRTKNLIIMGILSGLIFYSSQSLAQINQDHGEHKTLVARTPQEDAIVTRSVNQLIQHNKIIATQNIKVSTNKGVVSLVGNVDSDTQASLLVELAESVLGVRDVDTSKLTVKKSNRPLIDSMITAKIKGLLIREDLFGEKDIASMNTSVETKNGVVYLSGFIDNKQQIDNAISIIKKNVPEIKRIEYSVKQKSNHK